MSSISRLSRERGGGGLFPRRICLVSSPKQGPTEFGVAGVGPFYLNFTNLCELSTPPPDEVRVHLSYPTKIATLLHKFYLEIPKFYLHNWGGGDDTSLSLCKCSQLNLSIVNVFTLFINLTIYARAINWFKIIRYILCM